MRTPSPKKSKLQTENINDEKIRKLGQKLEAKEDALKYLDSETEKSF